MDINLLRRWGSNGGKGVTWEINLAKNHNNSKEKQKK